MFLLRLGAGALKDVGGYWFITVFGGPRELFMPGVGEVDGWM